MKFNIMRTSSVGNKNVAEEAHTIKVARKAHDGRKFETTEAEIEINTLEDLLALVDKYGAIIVDTTALRQGNVIGEYNDYELEIYDTWRE